MQSVPVDEVVKRPYLEKIFRKYGHNGLLSFEGFEHLLQSLGLGNIAIQDHSLHEHIVEGKFQDFHENHEHGSGFHGDESHDHNDSRSESHHHRIHNGKDSSSNESHDHDHSSHNDHVDHDHSEHSKDTEKFEIVHNQHNHDSEEHKSEDDHGEGHQIHKEVTPPYSHDNGGVRNSEQGASIADHSDFHDQENDLYHDHDHDHHNKNNSDHDTPDDLLDDLNLGDNAVDHSTHSHRNSHSTSSYNQRSHPTADIPKQDLPHKDDHIDSHVIDDEKDDINDDAKNNEKQEEENNENAKDSASIDVNKRSHNVHRQPNDTANLKHSSGVENNSSNNANTLPSTLTSPTNFSKEATNGQSYSGWSGSGSHIITNDRSVFGDEIHDDPGFEDLQSENVNSRTVRHVSLGFGHDSQRHSRHHERASGIRKMKQKRNRKSRNMSETDLVTDEENMKITKRSLQREKEPVCFFFQVM